jgi:hypothetical protein
MAAEVSKDRFQREIQLAAKLQPQVEDVRERISRLVLE